MEILERVRQAVIDSTVNSLSSSKLTDEEARRIKKDTKNFNDYVQSTIDDSDYFFDSDELVDWVERVAKIALYAFQIGRTDVFNPVLARITKEEARKQTEKGRAGRQKRTSL